MAQLKQISIGGISRLKTVTETGKVFYVTAIKTEYYWEAWLSEQDYGIALFLEGRRVADFPNRQDFLDRLKSDLEPSLASYIEIYEKQYESYAPFGNGDSTGIVDLFSGAPTEEGTTEDINEFDNEKTETREPDEEAVLSEKEPRENPASEEDVISTGETE